FDIHYILWCTSIIKLYTRSLHYALPISHVEGPFTTGCPFCGQLRGRKEGRVVREKTGTSYTTRYCGTTSAGRLRTDSAWNLSLRENAMDIALTSNPKQRDYLRRLRRSTISRYRSGSRRLR